jgi:hypothetical protein
MATEGCLSAYYDSWGKMIIVKSHLQMFALLFLIVQYSFEYISEIFSNNIENNKG